MKMQLTLAVAVLVSAAAPAAADDRGRTVCVLRARPVAIQPVYRPVTRITRPQTAARPVSAYSRNLCYPSNPALRVPVTYGQFIQRTHYVSPWMPNGYVGGIQNLPTNVVQIPPTFGRASSCVPAARAAHTGRAGQ